MRVGRKADGTDEGGREEISGARNGEGGEAESKSEEQEAAVKGDHHRGHRGTRRV